MSITKEKKIVVPSGLGNATPETVRKGVTFTSDSGIKQTGTAEAESANPILQEKTVSQNGEVTADSGYDGLSKVTVAVPAPEITTEEVTATPTKEKQEITPTNAAYISKAIVNPIPSEYVVPSGTVNISSNGTHDISGKAKASVNVPIPDGYLKPEGTKTITTNGEHDVAEYASVSVNVSTEGGGSYETYDGEYEVIK